MTDILPSWRDGENREAILDFALPPRCAGCAEVIADVDGFCPDCWAQIEWLGNSGCSCCGLPLEAVAQGRTSGMVPVAHKDYGLMCQAAADEREARRRKAK